MYPRLFYFTPSGWERWAPLIMHPYQPPGVVPPAISFHPYWMGRLFLPYSHRSGRTVGFASMRGKPIQSTQGVRYPGTRDPREATGSKLLQ